MFPGFAALHVSPGPACTEPHRLPRTSVFPSPLSRPPPRFPHLSNGASNGLTHITGAGPRSRKGQERSLCPPTAWGSQEDLGGNPHLLTCSGHWDFVAPKPACWIAKSPSPIQFWEGVRPHALQSLFIHRGSAKETEAGSTGPGRGGGEAEGCFGALGSL